MRTTDLRLGGALRVMDHAADLAAARRMGRGTLDGTLTSIQVGEHGVLVRLRAWQPERVRPRPVGAAS